MARKMKNIYWQYRYSNFLSLFSFFFTLGNYENIFLFLSERINNFQSAISSNFILFVLQFLLYLFLRLCGGLMPVISKIRTSGGSQVNWIPNSVLNFSWLDGPDTFIISVVCCLYDCLLVRLPVCLSVCPSVY